MDQVTFEEIIGFRDEDTGLAGFVCIDSTVLGPADGGVRMFPYRSVGDAVTDVTRLARAMTFKWAACGEARGGGKAVIMADPARQKSDRMLERFGRFVDSLGGRYWAGQDSGLSLADMDVIRRGTRYVSTLPRDSGGAGEIGPVTARGAIYAMQACAERAWGVGALAGRRVALQGLGSCGWAALELLVDAGCEVTVTDLDGDRVAGAVEQFGVAATDPDGIYDLDADIFAPFALGSVLTASTIARLKAKVIAGSANNILADESLEALLTEKGIVYAVDFIANAGGAIADAEALSCDGFDQARLDRKLKQIGPRVLEVLDLADRHDVTPYEAARRLAIARIDESSDAALGHCSSTPVRFQTDSR